MGREQMPEWNGKRYHPLTDGHVGDDVINEMGSRFRHASRATGGAEASAFTGESYQGVLGAGPTPQAQKPMGQDAALQKRVEFVFHKLGQACSSLELDLGKKCLDVSLDHLVERGLVGAPAFVGGGRAIWCRLDGCSMRNRRHRQGPVGSCGILVTHRQDQGRQG